MTARHTEMTEKDLDIECDGGWRLCHPMAGSAHDSCVEKWTPVVGILLESKIQLPVHVLNQPSFSHPKKWLDAPHS